MTTKEEKRKIKNPWDTKYNHAQKGNRYYSYFKNANNLFQKHSSIG